MSKFQLKWVVLSHRRDRRNFCSRHDSHPGNQRRQRYRACDCCCCCCFMNIPLSCWPFLEMWWRCTENRHCKHARSDGSGWDGFDTGSASSRFGRRNPSLSSCISANEHKVVAFKRHCEREVLAVAWIGETERLVERLQERSRRKQQCGGLRSWDVLRGRRVCLCDRRRSQRKSGANFGGEFGGDGGGGPGAEQNGIAFPKSIETKEYSVNL